MKITFERNKGYLNYESLELDYENGDDEFLLTASHICDDTFTTKVGETTSTCIVLDKNTLSNLIGQLLHIQSKMKK